MKILFFALLLLASLPMMGQKMELAHTAKGVKAQQVEHLNFTASYNSQWLVPNWVAWELTRKEAEGTVPRPNHQFVRDSKISGAQAEHKDYTNSGYDRGHMCPAADNKWNSQAMEESFYLSNICPQTHALNAGMWERLEDKCRTLAGKYGSVFICSGPIVEKNHKNIGKNGVAVPGRFFKVLCMKKNGRWQAIGFVMPNTMQLRGSMYQYAMSVDQVEKLTGHDFFYNLPDNIENQIEASYNTKDWE